MKHPFITARELNELADPDRLTVVVYLMHPKGFEGLKHLARTLAERGHQVLPLLAPEVAEFDVTGLSDVRLVRSEDLREMHGADVFFTVDCENTEFPENSVLVGSNHTYWEDVDPADPRMAASLFTYVRKYDVFLHHLPTLGAILEHVGATLGQAEFHPREFFRRTRDPFLIVPAGYLNLDALAANAAGSEPDAILYAPTAAFRDRALMDAEPICRLLLETFPDIPLIFRPHPGDHLHFARFRELFADRAGFTLDLRPTNRTAHARAMVTVTDASSTGHSFALALGRPIVRATLRPGEDFLRPWDFGYDTAGPASLIAAVSDLLANREAWRSRILANREFYVCNPGRACGYVADNLHRIARLDPAPDWFRIPRRPRPLPLRDDADLGEMIGKLDDSPASRALARAYLHRGVELFPASGTLRRMAWDARLPFQMPWLAFGIDRGSPSPPPSGPDTGSGSEDIAENGAPDQNHAFTLHYLPPDEIAALFESGTTPFVIWGASGGYRRVWRDPLLRFRPAAFLGFVDADTALHGTAVDGYPVHPPEAVPALAPAAAVVASVFGGSIRDSLLRVLNGLSGNKKTPDIP